MLLMNKQLLMPLGMICLVLSILMKRIGADAIPWLVFFEGLFLGLAFSLSVFCLIRVLLVRSYE